MSKGAKVPRSHRTTGLQAGQTLAHARDGGGVQDLLRRGLTRQPLLSSGGSTASLGDALFPSPVVEPGTWADSSEPMQVTTTLPEDGAWSFSWHVSLTKGDPGNVITLEGDGALIGVGGTILLGTVDAGGLLSGGGLIAERGAGQTASFFLSASAPPRDTDISLTVKADLIRRGLSGHT